MSEYTSRTRSRSPGSARPSTTSAARAGRRIPARLRGDHQGRRRRRNRGHRYRRLRLLQQRSQRRVAAGDRARPAASTLRQHGLGRRRRRRFGRGRQCGGRGRGRLCQICGACSARSRRASSAASARRPRWRPSRAAPPTRCPTGCAFPRNGSRCACAASCTSTVNQDALAAVALADYHHAQFNPRAVMYGRPLTREDYDNSRWIVEPFHLYDCCMENDGAAAVIVTSAERARDLKQKPVYVMAAAQGAPHRAWRQRRERARLRVLELQDARAAALRDGGNRAEGRRRRAGL